MRASFIATVLVGILLAGYTFVVLLSSLSDTQYLSQHIKRSLLCLDSDTKC
jgi:hypothetical protein